METSLGKKAMIVGLPESARNFVFGGFKGVVDVHAIMLTQRGKLTIAQPPPFALSRLELLLDSADSFEDFCVVVLPFHEKIGLIDGFVGVLREAGGKVYTRPLNGQEWVRPDKSKGMDNDFQRALAAQICACLDEAFPEPPVQDGTDAVKFQLLRGLASHNKMGPNNHSHEDDFWKERGNGLGPRTRDRIVKELLDEKIIGRKKNKSAGGTGWVYWIDDVKNARKRYPQLGQFLD